MKRFPTSNRVAREKSPEQKDKNVCETFSSALPPLSAFVVLSLQVTREKRRRGQTALYSRGGDSGEIDAQLQQIVPSHVEQDRISLCGRLHPRRAERVKEHRALGIADAA